METLAKLEVAAVGGLATGPTKAEAIGAVAVVIVFGLVVLWILSKGDKKK